MAQTTHGLSFFAATVDVSGNNSDWTELEGYGISVAVSGGDRNAGDANTFDGDTPIVKSGKRTPIDVVVRYVYTEETAASGGAFATVLAQYETAGGALYLRYSPRGYTSDYFEFTTGLGIVTTFKYPQGEAAPGDIVDGEFTVRTGVLSQGTVS